MLISFARRGDLVYQNLRERPRASWENGRRRSDRRMRSLLVRSFAEGSLFLPSIRVISSRDSKSALELAIRTVRLFLKLAGRETRSRRWKLWATRNDSRGKARQRNLRRFTIYRRQFHVYRGFYVCGLYETLRYSSRAVIGTEEITIRICVAHPARNIRVTVKAIRRTLLLMHIDDLHIRILSWNIGYRNFTLSETNSNYIKKREQVASRLQRHVLI